MLSAWGAIPFWPLEVLWLLWVIPWVILERRPPVATLAWISVLVWLPLVGAVIFYFFGPRRLRRRSKRRQISKKVIRELVRSVDDAEGSATSQQLALMAAQRGGFSPLSVQSVKLLVDGDACYDAIVEAVQSAQHHVHISYYIFEPDAVGARLRDALVERAKANVQVRVLVDALGSWGATRAFFEPLVAAGGQLSYFNPPDIFRLRLRFANFRSHRKIVVVDSSVGFTGGMNVSASHSAREHGGAAWRDTHVRISGEAVLSLQQVFFEDWEYATGEFSKERSELGSDSRAQYFRANKVDAALPNALVQVVASGPDDDHFSIHRFYFASIATAQKRVWITTPYFVPDEPILEALEAAAQRGIDVVVLLPLQGDSALVDTAARSYFPQLLRCGVQIWQYEPRVLHAKTLVIDDTVAIVGTANMDNRSFRLNFEVIAAVYHEDTVRELAHAFSNDLLSARRVHLSEVYRESLPTRFLESSARLLAPLL